MRWQQPLAKQASSRLWGVGTPVELSFPPDESQKAIALHVTMVTYVFRSARQCSLCIGGVRKEKGASHENLPKLRLTRDKSPARDTEEALESPEWWPSAPMKGMWATEP